MKRFLIVFIVFLPFFMFAVIGQNGISIAPDGTLLKWEEGNWDFFIMHKTLVARITGEATTSESNPQADTCIDQDFGSTYTLTSKHIPEDAEIDRAFLVWLSTQDPANLNGLTDNSVTLNFKNASHPEITLSRVISASFQGNLAATTTGNFEYEALNMPGSQTGDTGVYTYRVEVSDFMKEIIAMGEAAGMNSGEALYGDYNVRNMECSNHQNYLNSSGLVGGWFMPFVYTSAHINPKKIYFYNGLAAYHNQTNTINVSSFELPAEAIIKLGLVVFEGDPGLATTTYEPEGLYISSQSNPDNFISLYNDCNPSHYMNEDSNHFYYTEIFNSISSVYGWDDNYNYHYWCVGNPSNPTDPTNPLEYAIDADILMFDTGPASPFYGEFNKGDSMFNLKISVNQDQIYTNFLAVSVDTAKNWSDADTDPENPDTGDTSDSDPADTADSSDSSDTADTDSADTDDQSDTVDSSDSDDQSSEKGDSEDTNPEQGELHGECRSDRTCNAGLICNSHNICKEEIKFSGCSALVF